MLRAIAMKKSKLQIQMQGIDKLASSMVNFHAFYRQSTVFQFSNSETGKLQMCFFNIHDTLTALDYYMSVKVSKHQGERYLMICGAFQAMFILQDAISHLQQVMLPEAGEIDWQLQYPNIHKIRNYRNRYFGHPTEGRKSNSFHVGSLLPVSETLEHVELLNMQLYKGVENAISSEEVNVHDCIKEQIHFTHTLLSEIATKLTAKLESNAPRNL